MKDAVNIRPLEKDDLDAVVALSLRAWEPVYASLKRAMGEEIYNRQHPDWRGSQRRMVREACDPEGLAWVAEVESGVAGFVAVALHQPEGHMGEITILGVASEHQGRGVGAALTAFAVERLREAGMTVAMVETGGDPGHAPARKTYEEVGFSLLPIARYFKNL